MTKVAGDMGWVDFKFDVPPCCLAGSAKFPSAQAELGRRQWNIQNQILPNLCHRPLLSPCSPARPPPLPNVDLDPAATHRPLATAAAVHALLRPFQLPQGDHAQLLLYVQGVSKRSKLDNVWVSLQLIFGPGWSSNQLYKNPNIA